LHDFTVVDLDIHPSLVNNLILSFRKFVEDPRRACDGVFTNAGKVTFRKDGRTSIDWKTTGWDKVELHASPRSSRRGKALLPIGGREVVCWKVRRAALLSDSNGGIKRAIG
jgi:hypothetical protein